MIQRRWRWRGCKSVLLVHSTTTTTTSSSSSSVSQLCVCVVEEVICLSKKKKKKKKKKCLQKLKVVHFVFLLLHLSHFLIRKLLLHSIGADWVRDSQLERGNTVSAQTQTHTNESVTEKEEEKEEEETIWFSHSVRLTLLLIAAFN